MAWQLLQHAAGTLALMAIVGLLCHWRGLSPAARHALWVVVLLKLITPPLVSWPWGFGRSQSTQERHASAPLVVPPDLLDWSKLSRLDEPVSQVPREDVAASMPASTLVMEAPPPRDAAPSTQYHSETSAAPDASPAVYVLATVFAIWFLGAVMTAGWQVRGIVRFWRRADAGPAPRWLERMTCELALKFNVRPPRIVATTAVTAPMLWCCGRPTLLWPATRPYLDHPTQWRGVVAHELAHLRRRDHWVGWLLFLAGIAWWWHPLFWVTRRQIRVHAELACDAWVTWAFPDDRRAYAEALILAAEEAARVALAPAWGMGGGPRRQLQRRLTMIMTGSSRHRLSWPTLVGLAALAAISVPGWSAAQPPAEPGQSDLKARELSLREQLAMLEKQKKELEDKVVQFQFLVEELKAGRDVNARLLELERQRLNASVSRLQRGFNQVVGDLATTGEVVVTTKGVPMRVSTLQAPETPRDWGPEQATGAPNAQSGTDDPRAWASLTQDEQDEWLLLEYAKPVAPAAVMVFESFNPGALYKVSVLTEDGRELVAWQGEDPTKPGNASGVSLISIGDNVKQLPIRRVKLYLQSTRVPGWNEIDAVGLIDEAGNVQWATKATASSTYADRLAVPASRIVYSDWVDHRSTPEERLNRVEKQIGELKEMLAMILARTGGGGTHLLPPGAQPPRLPAEVDEIRRENQRLREELEKLRDALRQRGDR